MRPFAGYVLVVPSLLLVGLLIGGIVYLGWQSFHQLDPILQTSGKFSTENYETALSSSYYLHVFGRTLAISVLATVISVSLAFPLAYTMVRTHDRFRRFALLCVTLLPILAGELVRGYSWLNVIGRDGALGWLTGNLGIRVDLVGTTAGVTLGIVQLLLPLSALILLPALRAVDPELEQAANTMGARPWRVWLHVILPVARRGAAGAAAIAFTFSMTSYVMPTLLGLGKHDFVANSIQSAFFDQVNGVLGAALGILLLLIVSAAIAIILFFGDHSVGRRLMR
jgi:putative spermidine/putrescine transport system permease protein